MAIIQKALAPLAEINTQPLKVAPYIAIASTSGDTFKEAHPVTETEEIPNSVKLKVEQVTAPLPLPSQKDANSNVDYSYIEGLNSMDLDWSNKSHRNKLLRAQRNAEWNGKGSGVSSKGAAGPAQFLESTWNDLKKEKVIPKNASRFDKHWSAVGQEYYMNKLYNSDFIKNAATETDRMKRTIAAYNAGPGNVAKAVEKATRLGNPSTWYKHLPVPTETIPYLGRILKAYNNQPLLVTRKLGGVLFKQ